MGAWVQARRGDELVPTWVNLDQLTDIAVLPDLAGGGFLVEGYLPMAYKDQPPKDTTVLLATGFDTLEEAAAQVAAATASRVLSRRGSSEA